MECLSLCLWCVNFRSKFFSYSSNILIVFVTHTHTHSVSRCSPSTRSFGSAAAYQCHPYRMLNSFHDKLGLICPGIEIDIPYSFGRRVHCRCGSDFSLDPKVTLFVRFANYLRYPSSLFHVSSNSILFDTSNFPPYST